jgi:hypothetical protein
LSSFSIFNQDFSGEILKASVGIKKTICLVKEVLTKDLEHSFDSKKNCRNRVELQLFLHGFSFGYNLVQVPLILAKLLIVRLKIPR